MKLLRFRRPQFSLRTLFVLLTGCAVWAENYRFQSRRADDEQLAIRALSQEGARVFAVRSGHYPECCRYVLGPSFHNAGYRVVLKTAQIDDETAHRLEQIPHLLSVSVRAPVAESEVMSLADRFPALRAALLLGRRRNESRY